MLAVDGFVGCLDECLACDLRHPALGKAKTFRSRKQSGRPRSQDPMGSEAQSVHIKFKRFE